MKNLVSEYKDCTPQLVESVADLVSYLQNAEEIITFDYETTGLEYDAIPLGLALHSDDRNPVFVPIDFFFSGGLPMSEVARVCNEYFRGHKMVAHNAKYDSMINIMNGIKDESCVLHADTLVMVHLYDPTLDKQLEKRVAEDFGYSKKTFHEICGKRWNQINWSRDGDGLLDLLATYACEDVYFTTKLYDKYAALLGKDAWKVHDKIELPMIRILRDAKIRGVKINVPLLNDMHKRAEKVLENCIEEIYAEAGCTFNINSNPQKQKVFFEKMKLPVVSSTKGGSPSTDAATAVAWAEMGHRIGELLVEYSEVQKLLSGYLKPIPLMVDSENVLRGDLNSCGTQTGRMSSSNPNLQNQPNNHDFPIRDAFIPRDGYVFINYDYSQLELRVMAHMSRDAKFIDIFEHNRDPHGEVAKQVGISRKQAKCVNENTLIQTELGVVRIGELSDNRNDDEFCSSCASKVWDGNKFIGINSFYSNGVDDSLAIVSRRGVIRCSKNHKLLMSDGTLKTACDLSEGDVLADNAKITIEATKPIIEYNPFFDEGSTFQIEMDETWAYIAGVLLGDGCFSPKHIGVSAGRGRFFKSWRNTLTDVFSSKGLPLTERNNKNYLYLGSSRFVKFMQPFGLSDERGKKNFKIPIWILNGSADLRKSFLCGLIDTDGTVSEDGTTSVTTKSIQLTEDLCFLLNSIGYNYGVEPCYNKTYKRMYYIVHIYSTSLIDLFECGYLKCRHKVLSLEKRVTKISKKPHIKDNSVLYIEPYRGYLCDINVGDESHLYMSGTLITHNTLNFGVLYGMGPDTYMRTFDCTRERAQDMIDGYHKTYYGFASWKTSTENYAKKNGFVKNLFGRMRRFSEVTKGFGKIDKRRFFGELRQAVNTIIQGTGADIVKLATIAMCNEFKKRNIDAHFLLQVHDEVLVEARKDQMLEAEKVVIDCMENTTKLCVPLVADGKIIASWGEMKDETIVSLPNRFDYSLYSTLTNATL